MIHVINGLESGGAENMLARIARGVDRQEFDTSVVCLTTVGPLGARLQAEGIEVTGLGMAPGRFKLSSFFKLVKILKRERPDVVMAWLTPSDVLSLAACRLAGVKHLMWNVRSSSVTKAQIGTRNAWLKSLCCRYSGVPSAIIMNSEAGLETHKGIGFHPKRWEVIYNGFDLAHFDPSLFDQAKEREKLGVPQDAYVIGMIANFRPVKNHTMFMRAAQAFVKIQPNVHFVLAGRGVDKENPNVKEIAGELWDDPRLHLLGEQADVRPVIASFEVATLVSLYEGFPNVVGECMAMGVPCVVADTAGDAPRIVGDLGRVVEVNDVDGLVVAWSEMAQSAGALSGAVRARVEQNYSLEAIVGQYSELFRSVASESSR